MPDTDNTDIPRAVQNGMSQAEYDAWMFVSKLPDRRADAKEPYTYIVSIKELIDLIAQEANKATDRLLHEVIEQLPKKMTTPALGGPTEQYWEIVGRNATLAQVIAVLNTYLRGGNSE